MAVNKLFKKYVTSIEGFDCYFAGLPGYPRNFSRDTIISGIISADPALLINQLVMSRKHQGKKNDFVTGEEPGKIHHEFPGVVVHAPYVTTYNACDTTALYLIGLEGLKYLDPEKAKDMVADYKSSIADSVEYICSHLRDDIFWEFPPSGAKHFSLQTTYWKDSIVPSVEGKQEPSYPVAFALAQFQVARGILAAADLLDRDDLRQTAAKMFKAGIKTFITQEAFCIQIDNAGRLEQPSSDELHALAYIPQEYADLLPVKAMHDRAKTLVTPVGIACTPKEVSEKLADGYHGYVVWIFEQALINYGCQKFGISDMATVARRCKSHIGTGYELLSPAPIHARLGNSHQLWSVAAKIYFSTKPSLRQKAWL